jgi:hypothetical protein
MLKTFFATLATTFVTTICVAQDRPHHWHFGVNLINPNYTQYDLKLGRLSDAKPNFGTDTWVEYRFKLKQKGAFQVQEGILGGLQMFSRQGVQRGSSVQTQHYRMPICWTRTMPRMIQGDKRPLLESRSGIGVYFDKPVWLAGPPSLIENNRLTNWNIGMQAEFQLDFHIQAGTRVVLGWRLSADLATIGGSKDVFDMRYFEHGFTFGFANTFDDVKDRRKFPKKK